MAVNEALQQKADLRLNVTKQDNIDILTQQMNDDGQDKKKEKNDKPLTPTSALGKRAQDLAEAQQQIQDQIYQKNLEEQRAQEQAKENKRLQ